MTLMAGAVKWISKWKGCRTEKSVVSHHGWVTRKILDALERLNSDILTLVIIFY